MSNDNNSIICLNINKVRDFISSLFKDEYPTCLFSGVLQLNDYQEALEQSKAMPIKIFVGIDGTPEFERIDPLLFERVDTLPFLFNVKISWIVTILADRKRIGMPTIIQKIDEIVNTIRREIGSRYFVKENYADSPTNLEDSGILTDVGTRDAELFQRNIAWQQRFRVAI
ncbi:hypothetical protein A7K93_02550 [Candidatus Methylacidiphilum fumarolicum]|uniref:Uncharacterized protein n=2 Tax=Candidatus Methylacidiphilum fumarolicum TaxID=591154 RepID=I0JVI7_METFB|nr:hypothetical protein [Candidatus Methylacidiphilum fumarolicum]MBW6414844.1 hypothetical protein [Candidatus Methylacidiphilum fumarolicum]TFE68282.1 hypothetical protein A7K73_00655 [Candidatus Methylacidiphilum fumarolicum]TFE73510.1 hypothetical protein A7K72_06295 [Candidatus Methylacidiphilum fumarolicum]TFE75029.1 hypothetical protein A7K93_02550 [Candidatus Methylacidiphilum fumarolicum]TFE76575.1 hypothetical protein A7D33_09555 [Candidatus Methylacidiphilum fumarolicum]